MAILQTLEARPQQPAVLTSAAGGRSLPILTGSRASCFKRCRRQHKYRYIDALRPTTEKHYLTFGNVWHEAVELLETPGHGVESGLASIALAEFADPYTVRTLAAMFRAYAEYWQDCPLVASTVATEINYALPLVNPGTGAKSQTWQRGGKIDSVARLADTRLAVVERKTTNESIESDRYWRRLMVDPQITEYYTAAPELGYPVETVVYDAARKPAMSPLEATPPDKRKYKKDGEIYASQRERDETPVEWEARLYADIKERPAFYFQRREIVRLEQDVDEFRYEAWDIGRDIRDAELSGRHYRNVNRFTCDSCDYQDICYGLTPYDGENVPQGFVKVLDVNPELS